MDIRHPLSGPWCVDAVAVPVSASLEPVPARRTWFTCIVAPGGGLRCRLNGVDLTLPAEAVLVVRPGDRYEEPIGAQDACHRVHFHCGRDGGSASAGDDILPEQQLVRIPGAELLPLIEALRMECGRRDEAATSIRQGLLLVLVGRLARAMDRDLLGVRHVVAAPAPALHERLAVVFRRHEARHLAVRTMARDLGMSERHLAAECRARLGISPARAFTAHRMARAAELLAGTGLPVKAVADRLGFSNPFHFSRVFHRTHGCTPSGFRRCMRDPGHAIGA